MLYRASFYLYEIGFLLFAIALFYNGSAMGRVTRAFRLLPFGWMAYLAGALMTVCAGLHFYVYHTLSPQYMQSGSTEQLILMYSLKTFSMLSVLAGGAALLLGNWLYLKKIS
jgi:hypothetical protein